MSTQINLKFDMEESSTRSNIHPGMIPQEGKFINTYVICIMCVRPVLMLPEYYDRRSLVTSVLASLGLLTYLPGYCKTLQNLTKSVNAK